MNSQRLDRIDLVSHISKFSHAQSRTQKGSNSYIGRNLLPLFRNAGYEALVLDLLIVHSDLVSLVAMARLWNI